MSEIIRAIFEDKYEVIDTEGPTKTHRTLLITSKRPASETRIG